MGLGVYEPLSKLLVSPLITPIVAPFFLFPYITPPLRSLDYSSYGSSAEGYVAAFVTGFLD